MNSKITETKEKGSVIKRVVFGTKASRFDIINRQIAEKLGKQEREKHFSAGRKVPVSIDGQILFLSEK